jgi:hypothetical protein
MHNYAGYTRPVNYGLGDYIFLGILPHIEREPKPFKDSGKTEMINDN